MLDSVPPNVNILQNHMYMITTQILTLSKILQGVLCTNSALLFIAE